MDEYNPQTPAFYVCLSVRMAIILYIIMYRYSVYKKVYDQRISKFVILSFLHSAICTHILQLTECEKWHIQWLIDSLILYF